MLGQSPFARWWGLAVHELLNLGRRVVFGVATTSTADGTLVAHTTLSYARARTA